MKNYIRFSLFLSIFALLFSCTSDQSLNLVKNADENMHQFIERISTEINPETGFQVIEWTEWKLDDNQAVNLLMLKNNSDNKLEFKVLKNTEAENYNLYTINKIESSAYTNYTNVTWTFPHYETVDLNGDNMNEFVILAGASGIMETDSGMMPIDEKMMLSFSKKEENFVEIEVLKDQILKLPAINKILNQPTLSIAGMGMLNSTDDILKFLQETGFLMNDTPELVSIQKKDELFVYDPCFDDGIKRGFKNESEISDPAYFPLYFESGNETLEYTIQSIEEMSENNFELSIILVRDLEKQIFNTQKQVSIFWSGVWILQNEDFYYTMQSNAKKLKQIDRDCP